VERDPELGEDQRAHSTRMQRGGTNGSAKTVG